MNNYILFLDHVFCIFRVPSTQTMNRLCRKRRTQQLVELKYEKKPSGKCIFRLQYMCLANISRSLSFASSSYILNHVLLVSTQTISSFCFNLRFKTQSKFLTQYSALSLLCICMQHCCLNVYANVFLMRCIHITHISFEIFSMNGLENASIGNFHQQ